MIQFDLSDLSIFFLLGCLNHQLPLFAPKPMKHQGFGHLKTWLLNHLNLLFQQKIIFSWWCATNPFTCPTNKFDRKAPEATFGLPPFGSQQSFGAGGEE